MIISCIMHPPTQNQTNDMDSVLALLIAFCAYLCICFAIAANAGYTVIIPEILENTPPPVFASSAAGVVITVGLIWYIIKKGKSSQ